MNRDEVSPEKLDEIETRFVVHWNSLPRRAGVRARSDPFADMARRYQEPERGYHVLWHPWDCIHELDMARPHLPLLDREGFLAVESSIWLHDVIYDWQAKDNERRSADYMAEAMRADGVTESFIARVDRIIMATVHRSDTPAFLDEQVMVDIDLSIFGREWIVFYGYELGIWHEYQHMDANKFRPGRARILQEFRDRPKLYALPYFRERYEERARRNLGKSIRMLTERAGT